MSKHVDLIAVAILLLVVALTSRMHDALRSGQASLQFIRIGAGSPIVIAPPRVPAVPRVPHFRFPRV